ncbi:MAG: hypothetical protein EBS53_14330, partial [Bacteroidetes bacterium]|nr:hypothetical protein [Bacteroidota bacterium]
RVAAPDPEVGVILGKVIAYSEPPGYRIIFTDNHDKSGILNNNTRLANRMVPADPTGKTARKKTLLNAVLTLTAPGTPMLWMGQEFQATGPFSDSLRMNWREASAQHRIFRAHRDLIDLRESLPALQNSNLLDALTYYDWDEFKNTMVYRRKAVSGNPADDVMVIMNFSGQIQNQLVFFPSAGPWYVRFNSDWSIYGSDFDNSGPMGNAIQTTSAGENFYASLVLSPFHALVFSKTQAPSGIMVEDSNLNQIPDGWEDLTGVTSPTGDVDNDGISNLLEYQLGFDPNEADPTTVAGQFNGWNPTSAVMKATATPSVLQYLYVTETAALGQEMKFLFVGLYHGASGTAGLAESPGANIPYDAPGKGYAYFTFNTDTKAYTVATFTPDNYVDSDFDGMDDRWEAWHGVTSAGDDPDTDGFTNVQEFQRGSSPTSWNRPNLGMAGLNGNWNANANPLVYFWHNSWRLDLPFRNGSSAQFKFTATNGAATTWWGDTQPDGVAEMDGSAPNININFNQGNGVYRFQFNEASSAYQITYDATDANADGLQDAWAAYYGLTGTNATATADQDGDGISNLAEFRRLSSPLVSDRMTITGSTSPMPFWNSAANNMVWSDARQRWEWSGNFGSGLLEFKFVQGTNWYGTGVGVAVNTASTSGGANLSTNLTAGRYRFSFS